VRRNTSSLTKSQVIELLFYIYPPSASGVSTVQTSSWMNPIIRGQEANKLLSESLWRVDVRETVFVCVWWGGGRDHTEDRRLTNY